jgi:arylsulfatase A-like enzyme
MATRREFLAAATAPLLAAARKPNIVLIVADGLGYADAGFQGSREILTPNIDALAAKGVQFTNGYASHPFGSPARAGLLTGRYQQRFGHENDIAFNPRDALSGLPLSELTLATMLRQAGYRTGAVGKWHLGAHPRFHPLKRGFDEFFGFTGGGHDYFDPGNAGDTRELFAPVERDGKPAAVYEYLTTAFGKEAASYVERNAAHPFFLYVAFNAPHTPLQAPNSMTQLYSGIADQERRIYAAMVSVMDESVGRILFNLRMRKLERDTLIVFLSGNGGSVQDNASSNGPLRSAKRTLYEGGIRVPFAMHWTGQLPEGHQYHEPVISLDIVPTALAAAAVAAPAARKFDGVNLLPHLAGKVAGRPHEHLYWRIFGGHQSAVRDSRYKLIRDAEGSTQLYDLQADLGETNDLAKEKPAVVKSLSASLSHWSRTLAAPKWEDPVFHRKL